MSAVVDASLVSRALIGSQLAAPAIDLLDGMRLRGETLMAPTHMRVEFVAALRHLERRGRLDQAASDSVLTLLDALLIEYRWEAGWVDAAFQLARRFGVTVYDAVYLACAEAYDFPLFTCDAAFVASLGGDARDRVSLVVA